MKSEDVHGASAQLLGVALLIVTAVHITNHAARSIADEVAFAAAILFIGCCLTGHVAIRRKSEKLDTIADRLYFAGLLVLLFAALTFWF